MSKIVVCALYKFVSLPHYQNIRQPLLDEMNILSVRGTLLLASEGINGTVAASPESINSLLAWLDLQPGLNNISHKESFTDEQPFNRTKVKLKKEIVTLGVEGVDPLQVVGTYVKPQDWNALIEDPEVLLIDTRNDYEIEVGTFKGAVDPLTQSFRQFPEYVKNQLDPKKHKKVAMYCTGGIRCEKSTAYLKEQGFDEVYHLEGGILKYLEEVPEEQSLWQGECYVFDGRVAVNHQLEQGSYSLCHACRLPITEADKTHPQYQHGVSCPKCFDTVSEEQRQRFSEREKQIQLANMRGETHVGSAAVDAINQRRAEKKQQKEKQRAKK